MTTTDDVPGTFAVAINGVPYAVRTEGIEWQTVQAVAEQFDTGDVAAERSLNRADLWRRAQNSWEMGEGQEWQDREVSDPRRVRRMRRVHPWREGRVSVVSDAEEMLTDGTERELAATKERIYVRYHNGNHLSYTTGTSWTDTADVPGGNVTTSITTDGQNIYVAAVNDGIYRYNESSDDWTQLESGYYTDVQFAKGYLLFWPDDSRTLRYVSNFSTPDSTEITTEHLHPNLRWKAAGGSPAEIYLAATIGDRKSVIYRLTIDENDGSLGTPRHVLELPHGEEIYTLTWYQGVMLIGVDNGFRLATEEGDGLTHGPLIDLSLTSPFESVPGIRSFEPHGRFAWFGFPNPPHAQGPAIGRIDLSRFIDGQPLVPAWASDTHTTGSMPPIESIVFFNFHMWWVVRDTGVYRRELDERVGTKTDGMIETGRILYGLADKKIFHALEWRASEPGDGIRAQVWIDQIPGDEDSNSEVLDVESSDVEAGPYVIPSADSKGEWLHIRFTLKGDATLDRWLLRANPIPSRSDMFVLPLDLHTTVATLRNNTRLRDPEQEYLDLRALVADGRPVTVQMLGREFTAFLDDVGRGDGLKLSDDGRHFEGPCAVRFRRFDVGV